MILIADSGSTKTDWCGINEGSIFCVQTQGINPFHQSQETILAILYRELLPQLPVEPIEYIYFYGSGCTPQKGKLLNSCLKKVFGEQTHTEVYNDLLGAARALCGHDSGIACILGTGSNSCYYDGEKIVDNVPPLGYIIGDEGSGAYMGKRLIADCLKKQLPENIRIAFNNEYQFTQEEIIQRIYREPMPNRFLAGMVPFIVKFRQEPAIHKLIMDSFESFIIRNLSQYPSHVPVYATGSVAYYLQEELREAMNLYGFTLKHIEKAPLKGLVNFHKNTF